ncbi:MAG: R2-like ligand-binding oxidase [Anaerolineae bacterium]|nr:R2-like ligand-binding oxidase [Anaerolineae bacterium]
MHESFATVTRGLARETPVMRLFEKAKRLGVWNPSDIRFDQDAQDWTRLDEQQRDLILRLTANFVAGEEAVTLDILPLLMTVAREGRGEEELYLTTFLFEEAKHTDFFRRFLEVVTGDPGDLTRYHDANYRTLFYEALPQAMNALLTDPTPANQVRASTTYNMVVEGILAETGYHAYLTALERNGLMPGQCKGIRLLKQDESRHIAYGVYFISRHLATDPELWPVFDETMNSLLPFALGVVTDMFAAYDVVPFGLVEDDFVNYALGQFGRRYERIEKARGASAEDLHRIAQIALDEEL